MGRNKAAQEPTKGGCEARSLLERMREKAKARRKKEEEEKEKIERKRKYQGGGEEGREAQSPRRKRAQ